jgi:DNA mismatch repair protein MutL
MAIKANQNISFEEMECLIDDLRKCENPYTCPHGRPTVIFYSNYELEKLFKRAM